MDRTGSIEETSHPTEARQGVAVPDRGPAREVGPGNLADHLGYLVRRAQIWIFQDFIRTLARIDIRPAQYSVLSVIDASPGLTQAALAQALGIERARLVRLLDGLQARDLVERRPAKADRRSHALHLTKTGEQLLGRARALAAEHEAHVAEKVGPEARAALLRLLAPLATG